jgi:radical SAM protein with 4Fe4S-binding SPASM domain
MRNPVQLEHDAIRYRWESVPEEKRKNWLEMSAADLTTPDYFARGFPFMLQVEPTSICNLRCPLCPTGRGVLNRDLRHMELEEFQALVDDMERYLLFLVLWGWGEPMMNKDLPAMIRYASQRDIRTVTSTNGHFFKDEDYVVQLLQSGLATLIIAVDSLDVENYRIYRERGNLHQVLTGLQTVVEIKKRTHSKTSINLRMVVMKQNEHEVDQTREYARSMGVDCFSVKTLNPSCGVTALDNELVPKNPTYRRFLYDPATMQRVRSDHPCRRVWLMSNVFSNGDVAPCCYDYDASMKVGNILERPFTQIWTGSEYKALRKKIYHEKDSVGMCRECTNSFELAPSGWFPEATFFDQADQAARADPEGTILAELLESNVAVKRLAEEYRLKAEELARELERTQAELGSAHARRAEADTNIHALSQELESICCSTTWRLARVILDKLDRIPGYLRLRPSLHRLARRG